MMLTSPIIVYFFAWGLVLTLYALGLTTNLFPFSWEGMFMIAANLISMVVAYLFTTLGRRRKKTTQDYFGLVKQYAKFLFIFWFLGSLVEVYHGRGVPLTWVIFGTGRLYTEFGIPSFHGVMNACYLQLVTSLAYLGLVQKKRIYFFFILVLLAWPILMLGRGILLSALVQVTVVALFFIKVKPKYLLALLLLGLMFIVGFGFLGDMRQNANPFEYLVQDEYKEIFSSLPSGFLWVYVYLTAGLSNLFYNLPTLEPTYTFNYSFSNMLPTVVREFFDISGRNDLFLFVDHNLNTSTVYAGFASDFWILGGFVMVALIQLFACVAYRIAMGGRPWGIFAYTVFFQILLFSIFYDMFFLLPTLFQLAMTMLLFAYSQFGYRK